MNRKIKAVIFDLDGVLCFTDKYHYQAWKALADELRIYFDKKINARLRGVSRRASLEIILEKSDRQYTEEQKTEFTEKKNNIYRELLHNMSPADVSTEVRQTLIELKHRGYLLAIGSSSRNTQFIIRQTDIASYFDAVADGNDIHILHCPCVPPTSERIIISSLKAETVRISAVPFWQSPVPPLRKEVRK